MFRDPKSKYYVPFDEYPDTYWPRGCNGGFYTTNVAMVTKIWGRANEERIIRMDDIWITGILRKKCGIPDSCVAGALTKQTCTLGGLGMLKVNRNLKVS